MDCVALLHSVRPCGGNARAFPSEVVACSEQPFRRYPSFGWLTAIALIALTASFAHAADPKDIAELTVTTGRDLVGTFELAMKDPNVAAAVRFYDKYHPSTEGLAQLKARMASTQENVSLFLIPFGPTTTGDKPVVLSAQSPKGSRVVLGTISAEANAPPGVKEEYAVSDGKVQPAKEPVLKNWLQCTLITCAGAAGCLVSGPAWPTCLCLSCGAAAIACGLNEYLFR
jgi:hypothetical protein